jgi:hypothetical protein
MEVRTSDLYEAAYYLERGCRLDAVETVKLEAGPPSCVFVIHEPDEDLMVALGARWSRGQAEVNLTAFRNAYNQVSGYVHRMKRSVRTQGGTR